MFWKINIKSVWRKMLCFRSTILLQFEKLKKKINLKIKQLHHEIDNVSAFKVIMVIFTLFLLPNPCKKSLIFTLYTQRCMF